MFAGHTFCVSLSASPLTVAALMQHGGSIVYELNDTTPITCVVIANANNFNGNNSSSTVSGSSQAVHSGRGWAEANHFPLAVENRVRAARVPVVYELWVYQSLCAKRLPLSFKGGRDVIAYDPLLFTGLRFTTTQLPLQLKANIIAILQFYGAEYHRHMLDTTNTVVYSHMPLGKVRRGSTIDCSVSAATRMTPAFSSISLEGISTGTRSEKNVAEVLKIPQRSSFSSAVTFESDALLPGAALQKSPPLTAAAPAIATQSASTPQTKLSVAQERQLLCVTPQWVQLCVNAGELLPQVSQLEVKPTFAAPGHNNSNAIDSSNASEGSSSFLTEDAVVVQIGNEKKREQQIHTEVEQWLVDALSDICQESGSSVTASREEHAVAPLTFSSVTVTRASMGETEEQVVEPFPGRASETARRADTAREVDPETRVTLQLANRLAVQEAARAHKRSRHY